MIRLKKAVVGFACFLVLWLGVSATVHAECNHTAGEAIAWLEDQVGHTKGSGQCVALIQAYYDFMVGGHDGVAGNACDYATNHVPAGFTRIQGATPQLGDICIETWNSYSSVGHVWIEGENSVQYHQNYDYKQYVTRQKYSPQGFWGVIRPTFKSTLPPGEINTPTISTDKPAYPVGSTVHITWEKTTSPQDFYQYWLVVRNVDTNEELFGGDPGTDPNHNYHDLTFNKAGKYYIDVYNVHHNNRSKSDRKYIIIGAYGQMTTPTISIPKTIYQKNETVSFSWAKTSSNTDFMHYWLSIYNSTTQQYAYSAAVGANVDQNSYSINNLPEGNYGIHVYSVPYINSDARAAHSVAYFTVGAKGTMTVPKIHLDKATYLNGDSVGVTWEKTSADTDFSHYWVTLWKGSDQVFSQAVGTGNVNMNYHTFSNLSYGDYALFVYSVPYNNWEARSLHDEVRFTVECKHNFSNWTTTKAATCAAEGTQSRKCSICGKSETRSVAKSKTHVYKTEIIAPTRTARGYTLHTCSVCGHSYKDNYKDKLKDDNKKGKTVKKATPKIILSKTSFVYNGSLRRPTATITVDGKKLGKESYTLTYPSGCKNVGSYRATVKLKGNYSGSASAVFKIVPKTTSISKVTGASRSFTVKWKKQATQTTGYQIQYSTSKSFKSGDTKTVTVSKTSTTSKKITKLLKNKKYYVRIRGYKTSGGSKYYSGWSGVKSVKTK